MRPSTKNKIAHSSLMVLYYCLSVCALFGFNADVSPSTGSQGFEKNKKVLACMPSGSKSYKIIGGFIVLPERRQGFL